MRIAKALGATCAVMALVAMAAPAEAQRWGGRHRGHDHFDGGDFLLGALIAGGIVAIASSASKRDRERADERYDDPPPPPPVVDPRPPFDHDRSGGAATGDIKTADAAADACAEAAESSGIRYARIARVGSIASVDPAGPNWMVRGTIDMRDDYRAAWQPHGFTCNIAGAGAPTVRIEGF